jgi:hypothetical protein
MEYNLFVTTVDPQGQKPHKKSSYSNKGLKIHLFGIFVFS